MLLTNLAYRHNQTAVADLNGLIHFALQVTRLRHEIAGLGDARTHHHNLCVGKRLRPHGHAHGFIEFEVVGQILHLHFGERYGHAAA